MPIAGTNVEAARHCPQDKKTISVRVYRGNSAVLITGTARGLKHQHESLRRYVIRDSLPKEGISINDKWIQCRCAGRCQRLIARAWPAEKPVPSWKTQILGLLLDACISVSSVAFCMHVRLLNSEHTVNLNWSGVFGMSLVHQSLTLAKWATCTYSV